MKFKAYGDKTLLNKSLRLETGKKCSTRKLTQNQQYIGLINIITIKLIENCKPQRIHEMIYR